MMMQALALLKIALLFSFASGFQQHNYHRFLATKVQQIRSDESWVSPDVTFTLSLKKPIGLILEEVEEGVSKGVIVKEISESGSAAELSNATKNKIIGSPIISIQQTDVSQFNFEGVINSFIQAPDTVEVGFLVASEADGNQVPQYEEGTKVEIVVKQKGKPDTSIIAKVGDNLRQKLFEYDIQVYEGLKQNLGNCGGAGQCTFCAFDFSAANGWEARSEYEDKKLGKKFPMARLSCLNRVQGPATIVKTAR